jgi:anti-anti-sigma factor
MTQTTSLSSFADVALTYAVATGQFEPDGVLLEIELDWSSRTIRVCGELDAATAPLLLDSVGMFIDFGPALQVTADLAQVRFIDAAGAAALIGVAAALSEAGTRLQVSSVTVLTRQLLALTGALELVELAGSPEPA